MALETEKWEQDIQEQLFANNEFINHSVDRSEFVVNKTVHEPQAGAAPGVAVDRATVPATVGTRADDENTWTLHEFTTDPVLIKNIEEIQISYDKRQSVMGQHINTLNDRIGDQLLYNWSPGSSNIVRTSGASSALALAPGASGNRKKTTIDDIVNLASAMDADNIPMAGRKLLLPQAMFWDLYRDSQDLRVSYGVFSANPEALKQGVIAKLLGFDIMIRSKANVYDNSGTPALKAIGSATAADDNLAALAWHPSFVKRAKGDVQILSSSGDNGKGDPAYYGVILSGLVMLGGKYTRKDKKGIYQLVQAAA